MAVTQNSYVGDGSTTTYSFTFPYLKTSEIKASLDATVTTAFTTPTATTVQFNTAPADGVKIKIYRETDSDSLTATFYPGSAIKSEDLNDNFTQNLYATQEVTARYLSNLGGNMVGDLQLGEDVVIKFEGATDNDFETTLTVVDPTADRTITLPNVTGTVITTGDTGTVATSMIAGDAVNGDKIADNAINSEHYTDGSIDHVHLANDIIDGDNIQDDVINSEHIAAGALDTEHYAANSVDAAALAHTSVTAGTYTAADITVDAQGRLTAAASGTIAGSEIAADAIDGTKIADNAINSEHYTDGSIDREHLAADIVDGSKIADDSLNSEHYVDGSIDTAHIADDAVDATKLANTSVTAGSYTAADLTVDAQGRITAASSGTIGTSEIAADAIDATKIADNAVTTDHIQDAELTTLAGMPSGTASILASSTALTSTTTELNQLDGKTLGETTLTTNSDTAIPTSKAVNDRILTVTNALGGFVAISNETSFPATHPDPSDGAGTVVSVSDAGGVVVNGSGVASITNGAGSGNTVTINGFPSSLYSKTLAAGIGLQVQTTTTLHTYDYHKILAKEADVEQLSGDINDFNERYRVAGSAPGSNNDAGDLYFDTSANKMKVYNATTSAWDDVASVGNFYINTISSSSGTGGGSATFNGSAYRFTLSNPPTMAQQLIVSVNGVIQKPDAGSSQPSEGFAISGNDIIFSAAPASGADYFIVTQGSSVSIGTPSDNTVSTGKIQNQAVTTAKITDANITNAKIADDTIAEVKLDIHNAPATDKYLKYTSNGMEWSDGASEGTDVKSTGESGGTKFLREDGDGTCSWQVPPQVGGATGVDFNDNTKARFGTGNDLEIYHSGSHSNIKDSGTGQLNFWSNTFQWYNAAGSKTSMKIIEDAQVELYHDNSKKLETTSSGINVTGQINVNGSPLSAAPEITGTTDGAVTAGDPIIATSEGKLAKVVAYTKTAGTAAIANNTYAGNIQVAYDKISGKVAAAFRESSKISIKVGTISGTTVTWGSKQDVTTDATDPFAVGFHNNVLLVGYRNSGAKARVATVSGTTISTFGSEASISTSGNPYMRNCFYSEVSERWVLQWHNTSNYPNYTQLVVGTISGTTFSFGSIQDCFNSTGVVDRPGIREMPSVGKIVVFGIQDYHPEHRFQTRVGTIDTSDNSVDWETQQEYEWFGEEGGNDNEFDYYGTESDCDLAWHDDGKYAIAVAMRGGTSDSQRKPYALKLSYNESTTVFSYNRDNVLLLYDGLITNCMNAIYVPDTKEIMAWWVDRSTNEGRGWIRWKTIKSSGEYTLQFVDPVSSSTNGYQLGANDDTGGGPNHTAINSVYVGAGRVIVGYRDKSQTWPLGTYTAIQQFATTNAALQEFIGFASSSVGDNASLTVKVTGNTLTTTNLTAGKKHYVQNNGSLSTSPDTPSIEAGIALSSTKLLIKG